MPITDIAIRSATPSTKPVRLFDGGGLYLEVSPTGGKWWRLKYRFDGKEKRISLGTYPEVTLRDARERRDGARKLLAAGVDPGANRKAAKAAKAEMAANSFEVIAREWLARSVPTWNESHAARVIGRFERDLFPHLGDKPIACITSPVLLAALRKIEARGAVETAHRALGDCRRVFRYAVATDRLERNPAEALSGALTPVKGEHFAAVTKPEQVGALLRALDGYHGSPIVQAALHLAPLVFVRPGELRRAEWADIDLEAAEWRYHVTKTDIDHVVPLARQAVAILRELYPITGAGRYVFPSARSGSRPMSDNAVLAAMRRLGIGKDEMSGHGFRAMARTILDEVLAVRPDLIEHQLAHAVKDANGRAYNRTAHLPARHKMMQQWADYLDKLKAGADVIPLHGKRA